MSDDWEMIYGVKVWFTKTQEGWFWSSSVGPVRQQWGPYRTRAHAQDNAVRWWKHIWSA